MTLEGTKRTSESLHQINIKLPSIPMAAEGQYHVGL